MTILSSEPKVFLVANNPAARRDLLKRLKALELAAESCDSGEELLATELPDASACVLLDIARPPDDLELLQRLRNSTLLPVVAIAAGADVPLAVRAMKRGASDFLENTCSDAALFQALDEALAWHAENRRRLGRFESIRRRMARLTTGQREVLDRLVAGKSNREIADELELSVRAIEVRRAKVMQTMRARSLAELVRLAATGQL